MKIHIIVDDWGTTVLDREFSKLDDAIAATFEAAEKHVGGIADIQIEDEKIKLDFAQSPDIEGEFLKLHHRARKKKQSEGAKKGNKSRTAKQYQEAAKKAWKTKKIKSQNLSSSR